MNIKDIKGRLERNNITGTLDTYKVLRWLIAEVDRLENLKSAMIREYAQELIDTAKEMRHDTAEECAKIADSWSSCEGIAQKIAEEIREAFGL